MGCALRSNLETLARASAHLDSQHSRLRVRIPFRARIEWARRFGSVAASRPALHVSQVPLGRCARKQTARARLTCHPEPRIDSCAQSPCGAVRCDGTGGLESVRLRVSAASVGSDAVANNGFDLISSALEALAEPRPRAGLGYRSSLRRST